MGKENTLFSQSPSAAIGSKHSCSDVTHLKTFAFKGISGDRRLPHLDEFHEFFWGFFFCRFSFFQDAPMASDYMTSPSHPLGECDAN